MQRLKGLKADLVTLQECRRPSGDGAKIIWQKTDPNQCVDAVSTQKSLQAGTDEQVIWQGRKANTYGGVAVVGMQGLRIEFVKIPFLHRHVVPVIVHTSNPFLFVGVWTQREPSYAKLTWELISACADEADLLGLPLVAAGDFNISEDFKGKKGNDAEKVLKCMKDKLGLVSAYDRCDKKDGKKKEATHYFQFKKARPFHIDYCFVPKYWNKPVDVKVGSFGNWIKKNDKRLRSDHCPLTVDIEDAIFGRKPQVR